MHYIVRRTFTITLGLKKFIHFVDVLRTIKNGLHTLLLILFPYGKFRIFHNVYERKNEKYTANFLHPTARVTTTFAICGYILGEGKPRPYANKIQNKKTASRKLLPRDDIFATLIYIFPNQLLVIHNILKKRIGCAICKKKY